MTWKGIIEENNARFGWTLEQTKAWLEGIQFTSWRPSGIVLHNTAAPNLTQWETFDKAHPGERIPNLERYYRDEQGWSAGPHFFVALAIYPFTPINTSGIHSPSYNGTKIGIEMVGDYEKGIDDDDVGDGYRVKRLTAGLFAAIYAKLGIDPEADGAFHMHRDDPKTTHKCPGDLLFQDRAGFIELIKQFMGEAGEHPDQPPIDYVPKKTSSPVQQATVASRVGTNGLNVRNSGGMGGVILGVLPPGQKVAIYKSAMNSSTSWSYIWARLPNGKAITGWVASGYLDL